MAAPWLPYFYQHNPDETWESICSGCFRTVARVRAESDLAQIERDHVCNGLDLGNIFHPERTR